MLFAFALMGCHPHAADTADTAGFYELEGQDKLIASIPLEDAQVGFSVLGADVNGDGYADIAAGAPEESDVGSVWLFLGGPGGGDSTSGRSYSSDDLPAGIRFGAEIASADVNGDGYGDLLVGVLGALYAFYGDEAGLSTSRADLILASEVGVGGVFYGYDVAGLGDVDGDGYDDALVGAPLDRGDGDDAGAVYLHYGAADGLSAARYERLVASDDSASSWFGGELIAAGDLNGDGYPDGLTGAYTNDGRIIFHALYGGPDGAESASIAVALDADSRGFSLGSAGDIDGDGYDDALAVNYNAVGGGVDSIYALYGGEDDVGERWERLDSAETDDGIGSVSAGDVDGDGFADVLVGDPYARDSAGVVYVYFGSAGGIDGDRRETIQAADAAAGDRFGSSLAVADVDSDGALDALIGASHANVRDHDDAGAVYVHYGIAR